ncbi:S-adenosyl-L-methionine-dependent methyltransferase [Scenedesmus sp. NREL 46B-D3]|nr:S-adenosyl-L-methionine-dependent methyltransferase [Scenedesmus sp. NREL 46B-D3]
MLQTLFSYPVLVKSSVFRFRHFDLAHGKCAQKMGTDSMLLGAWAQPPPDPQTVLDVGTGTGVLALMMAQKTQHSRAAVHAIDIDAAAYQQAADNFAASPWPDRLLLAHTSFQDWAAATPCKYDLIISNPPFFLRSSKPDRSARAAARHADDVLPFAQLAAGAAALLQPSGRLCLILPAFEGQRFVCEAVQHGLLLTRSLRVFTRAQDEEAKRHIMQFELAEHRCSTAARHQQEQADGLTSSSSLIDRLVVMQKVVNPVSGRQQQLYSQQYQQLTADFHHPSIFKPIITINAKDDSCQQQ